MAWAHEGYREDEARRWVEAGPDAWDRGETFDFLVTDRVTGAVLGGCGLNQVEQLNRRANLGYWTRTSATERGVATEAAAVAAHYGLGELGLARLEIVAATANLASQRVAAKLGAVREGVMRNRFWLQGRPEDGVLFSLVPADLGERRGPG
jgi:RimJ/RimL family protein N-acetyltransferase